MNIHLPQTNEARSEAMVLMGVKSNTLTSRSGEPLVASIQDFITSMYLLTQKDVVFTHSEMSRLISAVTANHPERITIPPPAILKPARLWTGKQLFSMLLRPNKKSKELVNLSSKVSSIFLMSTVMAVGWYENETGADSIQVIVLSA